MARPLLRRLPAHDADSPYAPVGNRRLALAMLAGAMALTASWFVPGLDRAWEALDAWVYYTINGTVAWGTPFPELWALTGDRRFDVVSMLIIFIVFVEYFLRGDEERVRRGIAFGFYIAFVLGFVLALQRGLISVPRLSPSFVLEPHHSIAAHVPWSTAKEHSDRAFPGDHATVMFIITLLWWQAGGRKIGMIGAFLTLIFSLPRVAAGAHWATDILIGAGVATLVTLALVEGTPAGRWFHRLGDLCGHAVVGSWRAFANAFGREDERVEPPKHQILRGVCIGTADLIPGVSGGTMALILGVYRRLLAVIAGVDKEFVQLAVRGRIVAALRRVDFVFAAPLLVGILGAVVIFSRVVPVGVLIREFPEIVYGLFFGLIAASVVSLLQGVGEKRPLAYGWLVSGAIIGVWVVTTVPMNTPDAAWFLFLCGMAAVTAMLVPGVSGAFVLLILGKYADTIEALGRVELSYLAPLLAGVIVGALLFSRVIVWLLDRFRTQTMLTVIGMLIGSLLAVWPFQERVYAVVGDKERMIDAHHYLPHSLDAVTFAGVTAILVGLMLFKLLEGLARKAEERQAVP